MESARTAVLLRYGYFDHNGKITVNMLRRDVQSILVNGVNRRLGKTEDFHAADYAVEIRFVGIRRLREGADRDMAVIRTAQAGRIDAAAAGGKAEVPAGVDRSGGVAELSFRLGGRPLRGIAPWFGVIDRFSVYGQPLADLR